MPRLPVDPPSKVTPHGAFGFARKTRSDGACGRSGKYPCTHLGVDLAGKKGTPVFAPEAGHVVIAAFDDATPPLRGYGPGAVVFLGASGMRHILGHLDPEWWRATPWQIPGVNAPLTQGFIGPDRMPAEGRVYREGEQIGVMSHLNHVHWEVSTKGKRYDPIAWAQGRSSTGARGGHGALVLLLLLAMSRRK
jgi:murein DD-endopeptidase MepM/ murein hydrolase activator NlpD